MKPKNLVVKRKSTFMLVLVFLVSSLPTYGQSIFRPIDPNDPADRYGKSPYDSPPFLHFGSTSQKYRIAHSQYNSFLSEVAAAFASWNSAGPVQFSSSSSTGVRLTADAQDPEALGPAWAFTSWNGSTYEISASGSDIVLNTEYTWSDTEQHLNADPPVLDVQSIVVHEAGHIHGLAHPLVGSYTHNASAPTMAGGDNEYFDNTLDVRSLETQDALGTQWLHLRIPDFYSNLQSAVNVASQVGVGYFTISSSQTINSTTTIPTGSTLTFSGGARLNVNGTLNATGVTFNFGSPGSTNGIRFNSGSSGSINNSTIKNANYGIYTNGVLPSIQNSTIRDNGVGIDVNNVSTTATRIYNNDIIANSGLGVRLSYATVRIEDNFIDANGKGIMGIQSSPYISGNHMVNSGDAIFLLNNSPAKLYKYGGGGGYNFIYSGGDGIYAEYNSDVIGNGNDVYAPGSPYAVYAKHAATVVQMQTNYWGQYPPNAGDFYEADGATILYGSASVSPFTGWGSKNAPIVAASQAGKSEPGEVVLDKQLLEASRLQMDGRADEAIGLYIQAFEKPANLETKRYILTQLAEAYRAVGKDGFIDNLNQDAHLAFSEADPLYAITLELENRFLLNKGQYEQALANYEILRTRFGDNEFTHKHALFGLGYIHHVVLEDAARGNSYFAELVARYPNDHLVAQVQLISGAEVGKYVDSSFGQTGVASSTPEGYVLHDNYPNPFNPVTWISYRLAEEAVVTVKVFDMLGREVQTLVQQMPQEAGPHATTFDASGLPSGMYMYRLQANGLVLTKKMTVIK